jgi:hypothetical protein
MAAEKKFVNFHGNEKPIQEVADIHFGGNFTTALNFINQVGLKSWTEEQLNEFYIAEGKKKQS